MKSERLPQPVRGSPSRHRSSDGPGSLRSAELGRPSAKGPGEPASPVLARLVKAFLVLALLGGGCTLGAITYVQQLSAQQTAFLETFNAQAQKLQVYLPEALQLKVTAALLVRSLFTNGTMPSWAAFVDTGSQAVAMTSSSVLQYNPLITPGTRASYEAAALAQAVALGNTVLTQEASTLGIWQIDFSNASDVPHRAGLASTYLPIQLIAPVTDAFASSYGFDVNYVPTPGILHVLATGTPGTSQIIESGLASDPTATNPFSFCYVPVFAIGPPVGALPAPLAGILIVEFFWSTLLQSGVAQALAGIDVALVGVDGSSHSFSITDNAPPNVVMNRGQGVVHDAGMDAYQLTANVTIGLTWSFLIFPSKAYYMSHFNSVPLDSLVSTALVVAVCCIAFGLYDCLGETALKLVIKRAEVATRVVDDVLPSAVRDRVLAHLSRKVARSLSADVPTGAIGERSPGNRASEFGADLVAMGEASNGSQREQSRRLSVTSPKVRRLEARSSDGSVHAEREGATSSQLDLFFGDFYGGADGSMPLDVMWRTVRLASLEALAARLNPSGDAIADFYPQVTVFFSDIQGFTSWSSENPPARVFFFLETIFSLFDELARKHNVFKVETVGDAYVAAAGVPEPSDLHAVSIADFALDVVLAMEVVRARTGIDLHIRIGLHSGSLIGGVIRAKANHRFQLFGDTMNFGSRCESTGEADHIHVSPSTRALLEAAGTHTLRERGPVEMKGKGSVVTAWLDSLSPARLEALRDAQASSSSSQLSPTDPTAEGSSSLPRYLGGSPAAGMARDNDTGRGEPLAGACGWLGCSGNPRVVSDAVGPSSPSLLNLHSSLHGVLPGANGHQDATPGAAPAHLRVESPGETGGRPQGVGDGVPGEGGRSQGDPADAREGSIKTLGQSRGAASSRVLGRSLDPSPSFHRRSSSSAVPAMEGLPSVDESRDARTPRSPLSPKTASRLRLLAAANPIPTAMRQAASAANQAAVAAATHAAMATWSAATSTVSSPRAEAGTRRGTRDNVF